MRVSIDVVSFHFAGLSSTLLRDVPFSCLYWACYESLKKAFVSSESGPPLKFCLCAGAVGGAVAAVITLPFDVVKTHRYTRRLAN